jgi:hypothetical protein
MKNIKIPYGFGAYLKNAFTKDDKLIGLKSHDVFDII